MMIPAGWAAVLYEHFKKIVTTPLGRPKTAYYRSQLPSVVKVL